MRRSMTIAQSYSLDVNVLLYASDRSSSGTRGPARFWSRVRPARRCCASPGPH